MVITIQLGSQKKNSPSKLDQNPTLKEKKNAMNELKLQFTWFLEGYELNIT